MKAFRSLRWQLALIIILSILIPVSVIGYFAIKFELEERHQAADIEGQLSLVIHELEPLFSDISRNSPEGNLAKLLPQVSTVLNRYPGIRASYFNGSVIYIFGPGGKVKPRPELPRPEALVISIPEPDRANELREAIKNRRELTHHLTDDSFFGQPAMEAALPVGADKQGLLILNTRFGPFLMENRVSRSAVAVSLILGLFVGIIGILWISHRLHRSISRIKTGLENLANDLTIPLEPQTGELGLIVEAINTMRQELVSKRQLEDQLHRAERLAGLGQLVAGVAHEIRNPLGIIKGAVQLMERNARTEPGLAKYLEHLQVLREQVDRQNRVVEELLSYARPVKPQLGPVAVPGVLDSVLAFLGPALHQQGIRLDKSIEPGLPMVFGDGEKLKQVFVNLLLNAKEALPQGGLINITAASAGEWLQVKIADNGSGISPEDLVHVFEPFYSTKETGTGLGLSIAKQLMELNRGTLNVVSKPGQGTVFTVSVPLGGEEIGRHSGD